jgi:hypothetical protein
MRDPVGTLEPPRDNEVIEVCREYGYRVRVAPIGGALDP